MLTTFWKRSRPTPDANDFLPSPLPPCPLRQRFLAAWWTNMKDEGRTLSAAVARCLDRCPKARGPPTAPESCPPTNLFPQTRHPESIVRSIIVARFLVRRLHGYRVAVSSVHLDIPSRTFAPPWQFTSTPRTSPRLLKRTYEHWP